MYMETYRSGSKGEEERLVSGWKSGIALVAVAQTQVKINDMKNIIVYKGHRKARRGTKKSKSFSRAGSFNVSAGSACIYGCAFAEDYVLHE